MNKWIYYNSNPLEKRVGDCAIRACCKATNRTWNEVFDELVQIAYRQKDVLSANKVWGEYRSRKMEYSNSRDDGTKNRMLDALEDFMSGVHGMMKQMFKDADCREEREIIQNWARKIAEM